MSGKRETLTAQDFEEVIVWFFVMKKRVRYLILNRRRK
jgi:hypothetical protein